MQKKLDYTVSSEAIDFDGKTYFSFNYKQQAPSSKEGHNEASYVVSYEDIEMLHESVQAKNKPQLPTEEQIIQDSNLLALYL